MLLLLFLTTAQYSLPGLSNFSFFLEVIQNTAAKILSMFTLWRTFEDSYLNITSQPPSMLFSDLHLSLAQLISSAKCTASISLSLLPALAFPSDFLVPQACTSSFPGYLLPPWLIHWMEEYPCVLLLSQISLWPLTILMFHLLKYHVFQQTSSNPAFGVTLISREPLHLYCFYSWYQVMCCSGEENCPSLVPLYAAFHARTVYTSLWHPVTFVTPTKWAQMLTQLSLIDLLHMGLKENGSKRWTANFWILNSAVKATCWDTPGSFTTSQSSWNSRCKLFKSYL